MSTFKTPKGTELPVMSLRGKDYLEVKYRLVWFREEHPDWGIETDIVSISADSATVRAIIKNPHGQIMSMSHKVEDKKGFADFLEKAETGAIGRALALIGFGTQFCADDLDEGPRIVDAPTQRTSRPFIPESPKQDPFGQDTYTPSFGKYKGVPLSQIKPEDLASYVSWLEKGKITPDGAELIRNAHEILRKPI